MSKNGKLDLLLKFNFAFSPEDINFKDKKGNSSLYYAL